MTMSANIPNLLTPGNNVVGDALSVARKSRASDGEISPYHYGAIRAAVGGRTDHLPMKVMEGSYIIPADIVSARGEGNTDAGFKIYDKMFNEGKYAAGLANAPKNSGNLIPIVAAGGEYVIHPSVVASIGDGDIKEGHDLLDKFVLSERKSLIKTLKKLAPPKKN